MSYTTLLYLQSEGGGETVDGSGDVRQTEVVHDVLPDVRRHEAVLSHEHHHQQHVVQQRPEERVLLQQLCTTRVAG